MSEFSTLLLEWFDLNKRVLPLRKNNKPYDVWVSEIMLQQTKVDTVIPYYNAWMKKFPTIESVSEASEESILKSWEGLGYYSRSRNFHKAAKIIIKNFSSKIKLNYKNDPSLIGGLIVQVGSTMIDTSIKSKLQKIKNKMIEA